LVTSRHLNRNELAQIDTLEDVCISAVPWTGDNEDSLNVHGGWNPIASGREFVKEIEDLSSQGMGGEANIKPLSFD
jgi:hypothetical protein